MNQSLSSLPPGVRLGVSPLSWANDVLEDLGANIPLETCLDDAAAIGYQGVELGRKFPRDAATLRPVLESRGLELASGWYSGELAERDVHAEMAAVAPHASLLRDMGSSVMVYGEVAMMTPGAPLDAPMSKRLVMPTHEVAAYAVRLTEFAKRLQDAYGLRLAYHHHLMMVTETLDEVSTLFDRAGGDVGLLLDTGHAVGGGFDYTRLIDRFGDRIAHIHLKDVRGKVMEMVRAGDLSFNEGVRWGMFTVPGDGDVDFAPVADFVRNGCYRGWLVVEAEQDPELAPPKPAVTDAFDRVRRLFA
ncbi:myo-inosose-2 dehydratase [Rhizobium indigoferae]|uniref:Myo-inosose-2 dehydratase n=1 Tax=Rhizobium indigoferae TaxID=158891 RepID=A0ABZ1DSF9_9HYPH|nr:myo-inosose-2 dehydratase [Rhizobium indigoferae]NNU52188.1 myo-inosose-2 dehydratase [Rhizobium indigoferae]WRW38931.1 myo-inosose-2 dehydratase [Rhizobium indigoferae]GLR57041.1 myo-inosose-2 dehydratase [Rhizobium indigoferae]